MQQNLDPLISTTLFYCSGENQIIVTEFSLKEVDSVTAASPTVISM